MYFPYTETVYKSVRPKSIKNLCRLIYCKFYLRFPCFNLSQPEGPHSGLVAAKAGDGLLLGWEGEGSKRKDREGIGGAPLILDFPASEVMRHARVGAASILRCG